MMLFTLNNRIDMDKVPTKGMAFAELYYP